MVSNILSYAFLRFSQPKFNSFMVLVLHKIKSDSRYDSLGDYVKKVQIALDEYEAAAKSATSRATDAIKARNIAFEVFADSARELARAVDYNANGNVDYVTNAGFEVHHKPHTVTQIGQVEIVELFNTKKSGTIELVFKSVAHAKVYNVKISKDDGKTWAALGSFSRNRLTFSDLQSGQKVSICVCAVGPNNLCGADSIPVSIWVA